MFGRLDTSRPIVYTFGGHSAALIQNVDNVLQYRTSRARSLSCPRVVEYVSVYKTDSEGANNIF